MKIEIALAEIDILNKALDEYYKKEMRVFQDRGGMNIGEINIIESLIKRLERIKERIYV